MLNYLDVGEGEELVLIHGLGNRKEAWLPQLTLSSNYRLVLIELRGHGNSVEANNLTVETFAKDIIEVLDFLKIKKAHICGLSLGGIIAQEIYKKHKERVKSLILSNTTFYIPSSVGKISLKRATHLIERIGVDNYCIEAAKTCLFNPHIESNMELAKRAFLIREDTYLQSVQAAFGRNYFFELFKIDVPTLVIGSVEDKVIPVQSAYLMYYIIKKSKLVVFKQTGHLVNIEKAEEFNLVIEKHLNEFRIAFNKVS